MWRFSDGRDTVAGSWRLEDMYLLGAPFLASAISAVALLLGFTGVAWAAALTSALLFCLVGITLATTVVAGAILASRASYWFCE